MALAIAVSAAGGPVPAASDPAGDLNTTCPVMPDEAVDPTLSVMWNGRKVLLCCGRCVREFRENPAKYAANLPPADAARATAPGSPTRAGAIASRAPAPTALARLGRWHMVALHFPIVLLICAAAAELASAARRGLSSAPTPAALWMLHAGAPAAILAAGLGWLLAAGKTYPAETGVTLALHRWLGTVAAVAAVAAWAASRRGPASTYRVTLLAAAAVVAAASHFGGELVHGPGYLW